MSTFKFTNIYNLIFEKTKFHDTGFNMPVHCQGLLLRAMNAIFSILIFSL